MYKTLYAILFTFFFLNYCYANSINYLIEDSNGQDHTISKFDIKELNEILDDINNSRFLNRNSKASVPSIKN